MKGFVQKENEKTKGVDYIQVHQTIKLTIDSRVAYTHERGPDKAVHTIRFNWSVATLIVQDTSNSFHSRLKISKNSLNEKLKLI